MLARVETRFMSSGSRTRGRSAAVFGLFCAAFILGPALARAVSEESIGASPQHHAEYQTAPAQSETRPAQDEARPAEEETARSSAPVENPSATPRTPQPRATFPYTIRPGDNLGLIAAEFGISVADLIRVNHVNEETELVVGETLRIPNPAVARERELTAQINQLTTDQQTAQGQARTSEAAVQPLQNRIADLAAELHDANHDLRGLSWWKASAYVFGALALLMFGAMDIAPPLSRGGRDERVAPQPRL
jgi:LysM repeat protein